MIIEALWVNDKASASASSCCFPRELSRLSRRFLTPLHNRPFQLGFLSLRLDAEIFHQRSKGFCDRPRLGEATARVMWRVAIEDFRNVPQTGFLQMRGKAFEKLTGLLSGSRFSPMHLDPGRDKRTEEKGPDRPLMISPVSFHHAAVVVASIPEIANREGAEAEGREKFGFNDTEHAFSLFL